MPRGVPRGAPRGVPHGAPCGGLMVCLVVRPVVCLMVRLVVCLVVRLVVCLDTSGSECHALTVRLTPDQRTLVSRTRIELRST